MQSFKNNLHVSKKKISINNKINEHTKADVLNGHTPKKNHHIKESGAKDNTSVPSKETFNQSNHLNEEFTLQKPQKHKRKIGSKKKHDGASNWVSLCKKLNIATPFKKAAVKRPLEDDEEKRAVEVVNSDSKKLKSDIWFDNVDSILIESDKTDGENKIQKATIDPLVKPDSFKGLTNCVAMDCEMVGIGPNGQESILARVSIVNHYGVCLFDKFVLPREKVTDYRTFVSGVTKENLSKGEEFSKVQKEVSDIIRGRVLVGHAVHNDLRVLFLTHPHRKIRDTSLYKPFRELFSGRTPSLKNLSAKVLGVPVQEGQHSSIQDAQAAMRLYTMHRQKWEKEFKQKIRLKKKKKAKTSKKEKNIKIILK